jgi:sec-independent protein translocase protein TatC
MTFGEHLDELRKSLGKALMWLALGLVVGLFFFADRVVRYVQDPLKEAIQTFNVDRDLARLGFDPDSPEVAGLRQMLTENGLMWELVYDIPDELLEKSGITEADILAAPANAAADATDSAAATDESPAKTDEPAATVPGGQVAVRSGPIKMVELLAQLPDPSQLKPRLQLRRHEIGLSALKLEEPFMIWVKAGLIVGAVIASPMIFYHLWSFVAAGLHSHERRYVYVYLPFSVGLFISGVALAFFFVLQFVLSFLLQFNGQLDVAVEPRLSYYINFVLLLPLGFGLAFQLPLVMLFLERIGLIPVQAYISSWRIAILVIAVISMLVTPADLTSMISLMVPLVILYFLGVLMCLYLPKGRGLGSDAYDPA